MPLFAFLLSSGLVDRGEALEVLERQGLVVQQPARGVPPVLVIQELSGAVPADGGEVTKLIRERLGSA